MPGEQFNAHHLVPGCGMMYWSRTSSNKGALILLTLEIAVEELMGTMQGCFEFFILLKIRH